MMRGQSSPIRIYMTLLLVIFGTEFVMMFLLGAFAPKGTPTWMEAVIDAGMLTAIVSVFVWRLFIKPLRFAMMSEATQGQVVLDGVVDGIITIAEGGVIVSCNSATERMFGYESGALVGKNVKVLMPEPHASGHDGCLARYIRTGQANIIGRPRELQALRHDGSVFPIELAVSEFHLGTARRFIGIIRDITERRRSEEAGANLAAIVENANDAIISRDLDGTIRSWNWGAERMLGYSAREVIGQPITMLQPLGAHAAVARNTEDLRRGERIAPNQYQYVTKDGRTLDVLVSIAAIRDRSGGLCGASVILHDISALKEAQLLITASENRLKLALEGVGDGVMDEDSQTGRVTYLGHYFEMFGFAEGEIGNRIEDWQARVHPEDLPPLLAVRKEHLEGRIPVYRSEYRMRCKNDSWKWVLARGNVVRRSEDGKALRFISTVTDITESKRFEDELKRRDEELRRFRVAMDASADAIYLVDRATMQFIDVNEAACRMRDQTREEIFALGPHGVLSQSREALERAYDTLIASGGASEPIEIERKRRDGTQITIELNRRAQRSGEGWIIVTVGRDITQRKAAEEKIQRLSQFYAVLSQCNEAIARSKTEVELFRQICRNAVQLGGMKMAWIGLIEPDTRMIRIAARFGDRADEYLNDLEISADADSPLAGDASAIAIRDMQPVWWQDFQTITHTLPWHERRARSCWGASASLPLFRNGVPVGVLSLYAAEIGAFDSDVQHVLGEMAKDISFALDNFERDGARERAEMELRGAEEQFRGLVEQSIAGIYIVQDGKLVYANPRAAEIFGQAAADELIGTDPLQGVTEADREKVAENMRRLVDREAQSLALDFGVLRRDGVVTQVGAHAARATHKGRPAIIGLVQDISEKKRDEEKIRRYVAQLKTAFMSTVEVATSLSEMRDPYTAGHERRVGNIAMAIGIEMGLDDRRVEGLRVAGFLHDIGKITIPAEILSKPGKLTQIEYQLIQSHARAGYDVLKAVEFPWPVAEVALQHHERIDGSGYPQGLKGEAILFEARIMAVADVVEAMSSHRPYRAALGMEVAMAEIERGRGSAYDANVADACLCLFRDKRYEIPQ